MKSVTTHEAKTHLSKLLAEVEAGEEIIICRGSQPTARLSKVDANAKPGPRRPCVGTITSHGVVFDDATFAPLDADELKEWGL